MLVCSEGQRFNSRPRQTWSRPLAVQSLPGVWHSACIHMQCLEEQQQLPPIHICSNTLKWRSDMHYPASSLILAVHCIWIIVILLRLQAFFHFALDEGKFSFKSNLSCWFFILGGSFSQFLANTTNGWTDTFLVSNKTYSINIFFVFPKWLKTPAFGLFVNNLGQL